MGERREFDPADPAVRVYPLLNTVVLPRPIAWVCSRSADGVDNLAPHSYFTVASTAPPVVSFTSVGEKDSLRNVRATGEFVVHVVTRALAEICNLTSTDFPPEQSEVDVAHLVREPSRTVAVPRLAASPVALECRYAGEHSFGICTVVFGEVTWVAIAEAVLAADGLADVHALAPVARLGRNQWAGIGEVFALDRKPYARWREENA